MRYLKKTIYIIRKIVLSQTFLWAAAIIWALLFNVYPLFPDVIRHLVTVNATPAQISEETKVPIWIIIGFVPLAALVLWSAFKQRNTESEVSKLDKKINTRLDAIDKALGINSESERSKDGSGKSDSEKPKS